MPVSTLLSHWAGKVSNQCRFETCLFYHLSLIIENQVWKRGSSEDGSSSEVLKPPFDRVVLELNRYLFCCLWQEIGWVWQGDESESGIPSDIWQTIWQSCFGTEQVFFSPILGTELVFSSSILAKPFDRVVLELNRQFTFPIITFEQSQITEVPSS